MRRRRDVLWNATNMTQLQRTTIADIALQYKAKIKIVYVDCSVPEAIKRNSKREEDKKVKMIILG